MLACNLPGKEIIKCSGSSPCLCQWARGLSCLLPPPSPCPPFLPAPQMGSVSLGGCIRFPGCLTKDRKLSGLKQQDVSCRRWSDERRPEVCTRGVGRAMRPLAWEGLHPPLPLPGGGGLQSPGVLLGLPVPHCSLLSSRGVLRVSSHLPSTCLSLQISSRVRTPVTLLLT